MSDNFMKVKGYLAEMGLLAKSENAEEELVVVEDAENGIENLIVDCEGEIVILTMPVIPVPKNPAACYELLLEWNNTIVAGAFALSKDTGTIVWRDTLPLENLDLNEMQASINGLSMAIAENAGDLWGFTSAE